MFKKILIMLLVGATAYLLGTAGSSEAIAQDVVKVRGAADVDYDDLTATIKTKALNQAKKNALKKYLRKMPSTQKRLLKSFEREFYKQIDDFVIVNSKVVKDDEDNSVFKVRIRAEIDTTAIKAFFEDNSAAGNQQTGDASDFGALFIGRREGSRKSFDAKRVTVVETDSAQSQEGEDVSSGGRTVQSSRDRTIDTKKSGGSTTRKRDIVKWEPDLDLIDDITGAVEEALTSAGFEPMSVEDLDDVDPVDELVKKMRRGKLPSRILKRYKNAAIDAGWEFLGYGIIDMGSPQRDIARGLVKVPAKVSFKVWMLRDGRAKTVATVRPTTIWGDDKSGDTGVAETDALNRAVEKAMNTVVSMLQKKGIR